MPHHSNLKHRPYDGSKPLFRIGLSSFADNAWLDVDENTEFYLDEKKRLIAEIPDKVFLTTENTIESQSEVLELIVEYLQENQSEVREPDADLPPLMQAALMVQEDLVIMGKRAEGWCLVAGSVCFPSSWSLDKKIGEPLHDVHAPVPEFNKGTRNAGMIERILDNLQVGIPAERFDWSVYSDDDLYQGGRTGELNGDEGDHFLRVERQTITKLPNSGDVLFIIRTYIDPFDALKSRDDRREIALGFIGLLEKLTTTQVDYKGLDEGRDVLITRLQELVDAT